MAMGLRKLYDMINENGLKFNRPAKSAQFFLFLIFLIFTTAMPFALAGSDSGSSSDTAYEINVNLPAAKVNDTSLVVTIPEGMIYDADSLDISGASTSADIAISSLNDGSVDVVVTMDFGEVDNSDDQDVLIRFKSLVANVDEIKNGLTLPPITATLQYRTKDGDLRQFSGKMDPVTVIEPNLQLVRTFSPARGWRGDTITCNLFVQHSPSSTADAYDVDIKEILPQGLSYVPDSMEIVKGPEGTMDCSLGPGWHFPQLNKTWNGNNKIELKYKATIDKQVRSDADMTCLAALDWTSIPGANPEERHYSKTSEDKITLTSLPPTFNLSLADYPSPVNPGSDLTYTISYKNRGGDAIGTIVSANYDANTQFLSADPAPDSGTNNTWTLGDAGTLLGNASGSIKVTLRVGSPLPDGTILTGSATISCQQGASAQDTVFTKVLSTTPSLLIEKTASAEIIRPGGSLDYNISYRNTGNDRATNITITDIVDSHLQFDPTNCNPQPSKIWTDGDGTHLWWNASTLKSEIFLPGDNGQIDLQVSLPSIPVHPDYDWVYNNYKIDSNQSQGKFKALETAVIHSLYIRKSAEKQAYATGETVNYTLIYGNDLAVDLDNAVVMDILPDAKYMEYVEAEPAPSSIQGNILIWNIGNIPSKASGVIHLYAKSVYNRSTINFLSSGSVAGQGYVNFDQRLDTAEKPNHLTNYANITAKLVADPTITETDSSSATILLSESLGTALSIIGHGSGTYSREEQSLLSSRNKTIQAKTTLNEGYQGTSFSLPRGRSVSYSSKWSEAQNAKNRVTGSTMSERYMYADRIDRESTVLLDKNGSTLNSQTSFEGAGHIGLQKRSSENSTYYNGQGLAAHDQAAPTYESQEDYLGSFNVTISFDEYGKNAEVSRAVSGIGYAASDKRIGKSQGSYESGTGSYNTEDRVQTASSYLAKDIDVSYASMKFNYTPETKVQLSKKWSEGMWSRSGVYYPGSSKGYITTEPNSFISEKFTSADYLNKSTIASGLNQMKTTADFQGKADFKVEKDISHNNSRPDIALYEEYTGKYSLKRNIEIGGVAKFDEPHLSVSKVGKAEPAGGSFIDYVITVTNDGNRALGPVYVMDFFPPQTTYVYSSLRPTSLNASYARWTLLSLDIGATTAIDLKLNMTENTDSLINRIQADGGYDGQFVTAQNYSALEFNWLGCCPPQIWAGMTAHADPRDDTLVHYSITLKNREKYAMVATVTDQLPAELMFQNSSTAPTSHVPGQVIWNIIDLQPGEIRTIDYLAKAAQSGVFVNQAHIEAHALDGTGEASADVGTRVEIGNAGQGFTTSTWQPPACFGLNCTQQYYGDEWLPCYACETAEPQPLYTSCASCVPTVSGDPDVP